MNAKIAKPQRFGFKKISGKDITTLQGFLRAPHSKAVSAAESGEDSLRKYNSDWLNQVRGESPLALFPTTTAEVQEILKFCHTERIAVVPQGGNTGLVFGSNPVHDEVILSLERMASPPSIHTETSSATVEAGVTLQDLHEAAEPKGLCPPLEMGSKGSCTIAGNVATNAGGIHFARYGSMKANTLGLEVVKADGTLLNLMSSLRKDNTGYDLKQLFIGSEGTLGVITKVELKMYPLSSSKQLAFVQVKGFENVLKLHRNANAQLGEVLSAFEVMDCEGLRCFEARNPGKIPVSLEDPESFVCLIELRGSNEGHDLEKLEALVDASEDIVVDQLLSTSETQSRSFWQIREGLPVELAGSGTIYKFDVSFPLHRFYETAAWTRSLLREAGLPAEEVVVCGFGHFGDGNLHLNIVDKTRKHSEKIQSVLYPAVYSRVVEIGGSVSAEHGIGLQKKDTLLLQKPPQCMEIMQGIKTLMDPNGILNPYKIF